MAFKNKQCPKCERIIDHLDMTKPHTKKWYEFRSVEFACPYCQTDLQYDSTSQKQALLLFISSFAISIVAGSYKSHIAGEILMIVAGFMFWGSFVLFFYLRRYVEKQ